MNDLIKSVLNECIHECDTQIPFYAWGDNQAACAMAESLSKISDKLTRVLEINNNEEQEASAMLADAINKYTHIKKSEMDNCS